jgi:hypothetical protein
MIFYYVAATSIGLKIVAFLQFACAAESTGAATYPSSCDKKCKFTSCKGPSYLSLRSPDKAIANSICDGTGRVGHVDSTGEVKLVTSDTYIPISEYTPSGLLQNFSTTFFKSYDKNHSFDESIWDLSSVGHEMQQ